MSEKFNWGIIGPGRIAKKFAAAVKGIPNARVYALASRSCKHPDELLKIYGGEKYYQTYENLAADPKIDAIYISTPHRFHFDTAKMCLEAGKAVLCEKPLTVTTKKTEELIRLSQSKHIFLMEALWTRFLPIYEQVRLWLDTDEIGEIRMAESTFGYIAPRDLHDRLLNPELAGGALLDIGVYNTAISQWVFQENPHTITSVGQIGETGVDELDSVIFSYENGAISQFICTFQVQPLNQFTIVGTKGTIIIGPNFWEATQASLIKNSKTRTSKKRMDVNGFEYQIIAAMQAIKDGKLDCQQMTQTDTLANMQTMDTIRQQIGLHYPFE